jgi:hypothetical protein
MLQKIEARAFPVYLMRERSLVKDGKATLFHIRQMSHREATLYDLDLSTMADQAKSLDPDNKARALIDFRNGKLASVCEMIENYGDPGDGPLTDPVGIKQFATDYLTPEDVEFLLGCAKTGFLLREMEEEVRKNG